jgi:hypothetical protein
MLKTIVIAAFLTCGAIGAYGQTAPPQPKSPTSPAERTVSTGDFNVSGDMAASALVGAKVRNDSKETVGKIDDIYLDKDGLYQGRASPVRPRRNGERPAGQASYRAALDRQPI